ncbi:glycosyltransferase [Mycetocola zhujimingii]|uniref:Glycosyltransferase family 2 protein n=1 Tax=Mycetocola zhujimingii TaxID=2079792 RepID=A0A2U1TEU8_9MICO|nr:glycosyltransferase [Mycetocola zhujimingii]AWB85798.1 glycosyltransferase family 2 protein [Mycetocola zhujimingii]PWC07428.1 glycosyltransferase family 2 protein [Mycetocola zhujimingii]
MSTTMSSEGLLQRVIVPTTHDPDVLPLYLDADNWTSFALYQDADQLNSQRGFLREDTGQATIRLTSVNTLRMVEGGADTTALLDVPRGKEVSFGTYFNAFPASYWARWTSIEGVQLRVETDGPATVIVNRSNARGITQRVESKRVAGRATTTFDLGMAMFGDGGWYWFDIMAESEDCRVLEAGWYASADSPAPRTGTASVGITTFNRADYCTQLLADIGNSPSVDGVLDAVYVVDQGTQKIVEAAGYGEAVAALGDKLHVIEQANLGGSGGFSRSMIETVQAGTSDYVLLLDDDIAIEPEGIRRAVTFANYATDQMIVGGHMFDMYAKSVLHAFAEGIDDRNFMWGPVTPSRHDFTKSNLRQTKWLHRRVDAEYNGWWMSLIPVSVIKELGVSQPFFIKWDDAEYSLRAAEHGIRTVSLPGAAVWHVSWVDKDDSQDWQAFYHARNRLVAALLRSQYPRGGRLPLANLATDVRQLLSMQYFAVSARHEAYANVLKGPRGIHADMPTRQAKVRALAAQFSDGSVIRSKADMPEVDEWDNGLPNYRRNPPPRMVMRATVAKYVLRGLFRPNRHDQETAEMHIAFEDAKWWVVPSFDSVLISNAEGSGAIWHKRDPRLFRKLLLRSIGYSVKFAVRWPRLARSYRAQEKQMVSMTEWKKTLGLS